MQNEEKLKNSWEEKNKNWWREIEEENCNDKAISKWNWIKLRELARYRWIIIQYNKKMDEETKENSTREYNNNKSSTSSHSLPLLMVSLQIENCMYKF